MASASFSCESSPFPFWLPDAIRAIAPGVMTGYTTMRPYLRLPHMIPASSVSMYYENFAVTLLKLLLDG